ncbi:MAG: methyltransferase domain-containing protein, partial [Myxococcales bacterium]|nr:methyltransferase domain-containing protein [Myxococcales bacterium]
MRVVDLDRDMSDVIPTGTSIESEVLFERMTQATLSLAASAPGRRILDVASGVGQDSIALARDGGDVVGAEPSARMAGMAQLFAAERGGPLPRWVRAWGDALPFADASFDAVVCKGALDHFDRPDAAIAEMARVARPDGRVVLAIANFESLACRTGHWLDELAARRRGDGGPRGRRHSDCPSDHFTRYELDLMREQAGRHLELEVVQGVALLWGVPGWSRLLARLPAGAARALLHALDGLAARAPQLADVVVLAGRPRRS